MSVPVVGALLMFSLMVGAPGAARVVKAGPSAPSALSVAISLAIVWIAIAASYETELAGRLFRRRSGCGVLPGWPVGAAWPADSKPRLGGRPRREAARADRAARHGAGRGLVSRAVVVPRSVHEAVSLRLAGVDQRYTHMRRVLVETLAAAGRPLTVPEILAAAPELPQSSAYRNMTALIDVGVVRRVAGSDDHGRFELAEELSGHHHHFVCANCGKVEDVHPSPTLERALGEAARAVAQEQGYEVTAHQLDMVGLCPACRGLSWHGRRSAGPPGDRFFSPVLSSEAESRPRCGSRTTRAASRLAGCPAAADRKAVLADARAVLEEPRDRRG